MDKIEQSKAAKKQTIAELRSKKKPVTKRVTIQLDGELATEIALMREKYQAARDYDRTSNENDTAPSIEKQINELIEDSRITEYTFVFQSIGRPNYDKLVSLPEHKPTKEQKRDNATFNADTFPPALIAASCVDPELSLEEAKDMFNDPSWNGAELANLFVGALEANTETGDIPLSRSDSAGTLNSLLSLVTQSETESPTLSM